MNIEKRYWVDRENLSVIEVYIAPDEADNEWSVVVFKEWNDVFEKYVEKHIKQYNEIDQATGKRTGKAYYDKDLFKTASWAKNELREHIKSLIRDNRKAIDRLNNENGRLIEKIFTI